ncbi:hypothetical protein BDV18DRAFT_90955 [Aspergillus unguis]
MSWFREKSRHRESELSEEKEDRSRQSHQTSIKDLNNSQASMDRSVRAILILIIQIDKSQTKESVVGQSANLRIDRAPPPNSQCDSADPKSKSTEYYKEPPVERFRSVLCATGHRGLIRVEQLCLAPFPAIQSQTVVDPAYFPMTRPHCMKVFDLRIRIPSQPRHAHTGTY